MEDERFDPDVEGEEEQSVPEVRKMGNFEDLREELEREKKERYLQKFGELHQMKEEDRPLKEFN